MKCLQLSIAPLPQFITIGKSKWQKGQKHFKRKFGLYDMLFVKKGKHFMSEAGAAYEISDGGILVLEPNQLHWGHAACQEETELYWIHFLHAPAARVIDHEHIPWHYILHKGNDFDLEPAEQYMYIPKFAHLDLSYVYPILDQMVDLHRHYATKHALPLHSLLIQLFVQLQGLMKNTQELRSQQLAEAVSAYLRNHLHEPFHTKMLENQFHYHYDYLARCLKQHTGMSPLQYIHHQQIEKAKFLLEHTDQSIGQICEQVGYSNYNYFTRLFRSKLGISPKKYRISSRSYV